MSNEFQIKKEKRTCKGCGAERIIPVVYNGTVEKKELLCKYCHTDAKRFRSQIMPYVRRMLEKIANIIDFKQTAKHFIGHLSEKNSEDIKRIKCSADAKKVATGKMSFIEYRDKHHDNIVMAMRKLMSEIKEDSKIFYLPIENVEPAKEDLDDFLVFMKEDWDIINNSDDLYRAIHIIHTDMVFRKLSKAEEERNVYECKRLYVEAQTRNLKKTQMRFVGLFDKFKDKEARDIAVDWAEMPEEHLIEKTVDDLVEHFAR